MKYGFVYKYDDDTYASGQVTATNIDDALITLSEHIKMKITKTIRYVLLHRKSYKWTYTITIDTDRKVSFTRVTDLDITLHNKQPAMTMRRARQLMMESNE